MKNQDEIYNQNSQTFSVELELIKQIEGRISQEDKEYFSDISKNKNK